MNDFAHPVSISLGQVLIDSGLLTAEQLRDALLAQTSDSQRKMLGEILIERGFVSQEQLLRALASAKGLEFIDHPSEVADPGVRALVPEAIRNENDGSCLFMMVSDVK